MTPLEWVFIDYRLTRFHAALDSLYLPGASKRFSRCYAKRSFQSLEFFAPSLRLPLYRLQSWISNVTSAQACRVGIHRCLTSRGNKTNHQFMKFKFPLEIELPHLAGCSLFPGTRWSNASIAALNMVYPGRTISWFHWWNIGFVVVANSQPLRLMAAEEFTQNIERSKGSKCKQWVYTVYSIHIVISISINHLTLHSSVVYSI